MPDRTCPVCQTTFTPRTWNQKYCTGYRGKCYRRAMNASYRGRPLITGEVGAHFDCAQCGTHCTPGKNDVAPHATRFCGHDCKKEWHRTNVEIPNQVRASLVTPSPLDDGRYRRAMRQDPCAYCGAPAQALDHIVPKSHGGSDDWTNRTAACHRCNNMKMQTPMLHFLAYKQARDEFEPWRSIVAAIHTRDAA